MKNKKLLIRYYNTGGTMLDGSLTEDPTKPTIVKSVADIPPGATKIILPNGEIGYVIKKTEVTNTPGEFGITSPTPGRREFKPGTTGTTATQEQKDSFKRAMQTKPVRHPGFPGKWVVIDPKTGYPFEYPGSQDVQEIKQYFKLEPETTKPTIAPSGTQSGLSFTMSPKGLRMYRDTGGSSAENYNPQSPIITPQQYEAAKREAIAKGISLEEFTSGYESTLYEGAPGYKVLSREDNMGSQRKDILDFSTSGDFQNNMTREMVNEFRKMNQSRGDNSFSPQYKITSENVQTWLDHAENVDKRTGLSRKNASFRQFLKNLQEEAAKFKQFNTIQ